jgi:hypothetical protein
LNFSIRSAGFVVALMAIAAVAGYGVGRRHGRSAADAHLEAAAPARIASTRLTPPLAAATYVGGHWPKNFINAFRRERVADDFARLRSDGFNAVVLLVSWGDFQPVFDPCCRYDERAFERLEYLLDRAAEAGLDVVLRVGYGWTFHPDAGDVGTRTQRLLNESGVRGAFAAYAARIGAIARKHANVRLTLLSWEDLWLHAVDPAGRADFERFVATLPDGDAKRAASGGGVPVQTGDDPTLFNAYWDWLMMQQVFEPLARRLPNLSYEARIDREPLFKVDGAGVKSISAWIGHETTYRPPGADVISLYWAPFWGARNQGETLDADQSLRLFGRLLDDVRQHSGGLPMFIDQLNIIDNTLGFEHNATLQPAAYAGFVSGALCTMRKAGVFGYAYWTTSDYAESPLYNPAFAYALDGWTLAADGTPGAQRLQARPSGDFDLRLRAGDRLSQTIPARRGRFPGRRDQGPVPARVCVATRDVAAAEIEVAAGAAPVHLAIAAGTSRTCADITTAPVGDNLELALRMLDGSADLTDVMLFDHVQQGGLHGFDGADGVLLAPLRSLNRAFTDTTPAQATCGR